MIDLWLDTGTAGIVLIPFVLLYAIAAAIVWVTHLSPARGFFASCVGIAGPFFVSVAVLFSLFAVFLASEVLRQGERAHAAVAAEADGMTLGTGVILLPLHQPVDLAEQLATLDVITGGRLIVGLGLGYRDVENLAMGHDPSSRVGRLVEGLQALERLWTGEPASLDGKHFQLRDVRISMPPLQRPRPPIWLAASGDAGVKRAAQADPHLAVVAGQSRLDVVRGAVDERQVDPARRLVNAPDHEHAGFAQDQKRHALTGHGDVALDEPAIPGQPGEHVGDARLRHGEPAAPLQQVG